MMICDVEMAEERGIGFLDEAGLSTGHANFHSRRTGGAGNLSERAKGGFR